MEQNLPVRGALLRGVPKVACRNRWRHGVDGDAAARKHVWMTLLYIVAGKRWRGEFSMTYAERVTYRLPLNLHPYNA